MINPNLPDSTQLFTTPSGSLISKEGEKPQKHTSSTNSLGHPVTSGGVAHETPIDISIFSQAISTDAHILKSTNAEVSVFSQAKSTDGAIKKPSVALIDSSASKTVSKTSHVAASSITTSTPSHQKANLPSNTIKSVEASWARRQTIANETKTGHAELIDHTWTAVLPGENSGIIVDKFLGQGTIKEAFDATVKNKKGEWESGFVALVDKRMKAQRKVPLPEGSPTPKPPSENMPQGHHPTYLLEVRRANETNGLPGIWPTHTVTTIDGETMMVRKKAGFTFRENTADKATVKDFEGLNKLWRDDLLKPTDIPKALNLFNGVIEGVESLHNKNMVHRDLKLGNYLCGQNGEGAVSDLDTVGPANWSDFSGGNQPPGTRPFWAPEIMRTATDKPEQIGKPADIWALGASLWDMYTDGLDITQHPIYPENANEILEQEGQTGLVKAALVRVEDGSYLKEYPEPSNNDSIAWLAWKCMRPDPADRPTIQEVKEKYNIAVQKLQPLYDSDDSPFTYRDAFGQD